MEKKMETTLTGFYRVQGYMYGGFPKIGIPFWGVPKIRILAFWGLYWGPLILGNYHFYKRQLSSRKPAVLLPLSRGLARAYHANWTWMGLWTALPLPC